MVGAIGIFWGLIGWGLEDPAILAKADRHGPLAGTDHHLRRGTGRWRGQHHPAGQDQAQAKRERREQQGMTWASARFLVGPRHGIASRSPGLGCRAA